MTKRRDGWQSPIVLEYRVGQLADLQSNPKAITTKSLYLLADDGTASAVPTRIFFGQPDLVDESRFSILFQTPTETKLIQGQLLADDTIHFDIVAAPESMIPKSPTTR